MKSTIYLLLMGLIMAYSCKSDHINNELVINPLITVERDVWLSEFSDEVTYIPIDNKILFQHPVRIEVSESRFFVKAYPGGILAFDRKGNLINEIGREGRGPGEYRSGGHFTKDVKNERIYIYDNPRIISYDFSGNFIREFSLFEHDDSFCDIEFSNGKIYLASSMASGHTKYNWIVIDTIGNLCSFKLNSLPRFKTTFLGTGSFYSYSGDIYYWNYYIDTIFQIQKDIYYPAGYIKQGEYSIPQGNLPLGEDRHKIFMPNKIFRTKHFVFLSYRYEGFLQSGVINNKQGIINVIGKTGSISGYDLHGIPNDIDGGPAFAPFFYFQENNEEYLLGWIHAYKLKTHVESDAFKNSTPKYPEKKKELEELAASLDENDNPVLMLVKLKE